MGYSRVARFFAGRAAARRPVIAAGLRVAAVSNVSLVSVARSSASPSSGCCFTDGFSRELPRPDRRRHRRLRLLALLFDVVIVAAHLGCSRRGSERRGRGHDRQHPRLAHRPGPLDRAPTASRTASSSTSATPGSRCCIAALIAIPLGARGRPHRPRPRSSSSTSPAPPAPSRASACSSPWSLLARPASCQRRLRRTSCPSVIVLVLLAIPPILSGTYAGVEGVDPAARDAAKGMGMTRQRRCCARSSCPARCR